MTRSENSTTSSVERESTRNITPKIFSEARTSIPYSETWVSAHSGEVSAALWNESSADSEGSRTSKAQAARPEARTWSTISRLAPTGLRLGQRERKRFPGLQRQRKQTVRGPGPEPLGEPEVMVV